LPKDKQIIGYPKLNINDVEYNIKASEGIIFITNSISLDVIIDELIALLNKIESDYNIKNNLMDYHTMSSNMLTNIKVKNEVDKKLSINVDERKFYQVLVNLFSNAVKFTDKGYILFSAKENKISWEISVKDTGIGIPPEQIPRLFDKFYQVEHHMTRKKGGTGLGLAIVKKLAEMHNGSIKVKSELGKGTIFTVIIPKPYLSVNFKS